VILGPLRVASGLRSAHAAVSRAGAGAWRLRVAQAAALLGLLLFAPAGARGNFPFPDPPPPVEYGNLLLNRTARANGVKAVSFSHWMHRQRYSCRVCHFELQFNLQAGTTEITEEANRAGMFCGACHDGKKLFGHERKEDCERCHNDDLRHGSERFLKLWRLPLSKYGNLIDWTAALKSGQITLTRQLTIPPAADTGFARSILLKSTWFMGTDAVFPHGEHSVWHDCNDCHPGIFNIRKKATEGLQMNAIIGGQYCGVCHGRVAFPLTDCVRCHPQMRKVPQYKTPAPELRPNR